MNKEYITIQQTLHGYSNGHHMLEASLVISDESKRKMNTLSDYSNTELSEDLNSYYTGYFLEKERFVVIAKTWYAHEMARPGCVWTHSLLIRIEDLAFCANNINSLLSLFIRPNDENTRNAYAEPVEIIVYGTEKDSFDRKKLQYLIWIIMGQTPPNYVLSKNSEEYILELLLVWFTCYHELQNNFSFITSTGSIKSGSTSVISLQFCSTGGRSAMSNLSSEISLMRSIDEVQKFPPWVMYAYDLVINKKWEEFKKFKNLFNSIESKKLELSTFIKLYSCFYIGNNCIDVYGSLELIDKVLQKNKSIVGNDFLGLYFNKKFEYWGKYFSESNLVIASLKFPWVCLPSTTLGELITKSLENDIVNAKKVVRYLVNLESPDIQEKYLMFYANSLSLNNFETFTEMDYSICNVLVSINPILAKCQVIWEQSIGFQQGILDSLKICKTIERLDEGIISVVLNTSKFDFAIDIYAIWKEKSISEFLKCLLHPQYLGSRDNSKMIALCKKHSWMASQVLTESFSKFSPEQILTLFNIVNPYSDEISINVLSCVFSKLKYNSLSEEQKNEAADFYLPFVLRDNYSFPDEIVSFSVLNVHERLSNLSYPDSKWRKLQKLLPEVGYFNQWDKCKRLRKAVKKKGFTIKQLNSYNDNELDIHLL